MNSVLSDLENNIHLKSRLLSEGCGVCDSINSLNTIQRKKIHLYAHSIHRTNQEVPDDFLLGESDSACIVRVRLNPSSPFKIVKDDRGYFILDSQNATSIPIRFVPKFDSEEKLEDSTSVGTVCSFLGTDLIGITPSNHCFYVKDKQVCKFCEIWENYNEHITYKKPLKKPEIIKQAVCIALERNPHLQHLAITSGNVKSYDYTTQFFCAIGEALKTLPVFNQLKHTLATLMPPTDFELIKNLKAAGFNKVYYPLEVYDQQHFKIVCPGKNSFGYEKMLDALSYALDVFGEGNVYTNLVYGVQSLNCNLESSSFNASLENEKCLYAVESLLQKKIIPVFTIYHYSGHNKIGNIKLESEALADFFIHMGLKIAQANLVPHEEMSIIFSPLSLSNTLYNESFKLAKLRIT